MVNAHTFNIGFAGGNYAWDRALTAPDRVAELLSNLVFAHRSFPMLAFLLGVGLVLQTRTLARPEVSSALFGRYMALLLVGVAHGLLLWPGDILAAYAIIVLTLARYAVAWSGTAVKLVLGVLFTATFATTTYWAFGDQSPLRCGPDAMSMEASFAQGNWLTARGQGAAEFLINGLLGHALNPVFWALVLLGVWCARSAAFWQHLRQPSFFHPVVLASAAVLAWSTAAEWTFGRAGAWSSLGCQGGVVSQFLLAETTTPFVCIPVLLTLFAWLAQRYPRAPALMRLMAVGRAPLTMFLGQSIVFSILFSQTFLGLHGHLGRAGVLLIALLTFMLLAAWIDYRYLGRGRVPPGERLWRAMARRFSRSR